jgi:hypothetical protein
MKMESLAGRYSRYFFAALLLLNLGFPQWACAAAPPTIPMQQLLDDPEKFEGHTVRVVGFLRLEFERNALYLNRDDFNKSVMKHALLLDLTNGQLRSSSKLNNGHVIVEGVFSAKDIGHGGMWPGALKPVVRLHMWRIYRRK